MIIWPDGPVGDLPQAEGIEAELRGDGAVVLSYRSRQTSAERVLEVVHGAGIRIRDVQTQEPDLEDVFLALTSRRPGALPPDPRDISPPEEDAEAGHRRG